MPCACTNTVRANESASVLNPPLQDIARGIYVRSRPIKGAAGPWPHGSRRDLYVCGRSGRASENLKLAALVPERRPGCFRMSALAAGTSGLSPSRRIGTCLMRPGSQGGCWFALIPANRSRSCTSGPEAAAAAAAVAAVASDSGARVPVREQWAHQQAGWRREERRGGGEEGGGVFEGRSAATAFRAEDF